MSADVNADATGEATLLTSFFLKTPKRDSSTPRPDPEIDTTDLRKRINRRDAPLRMTCWRGCASTTQAIPTGA